MTLQTWAWDVDLHIKQRLSPVDPVVLKFFGNKNSIKSV